MTEVTKTNDIPIAAVKGDGQLVVGLIAGFTVGSVGVALIWTVLFANALFKSFSDAWEWKCSNERLQGELAGEKHINAYLLNENDRIVKRWTNAPPAPRCCSDLNITERVPEPPIP